MTAVASIRRISPQEALQAMETGGYGYLDVRSEEEFGLGHPAGAYNIALQHMGEAGMVDNADFVATVRANFATDAKLILGCRSGRRSMRAAQILIDAGFSKLVEQRAGFEGPKDAFGRVEERGWQACGLPCSMDAMAGRSHRELSAESTTPPTTTPS